MASLLIAKSNAKNKAGEVKTIKFSTITLGAAVPI